MGNRLYIANLSYDTEESTLESLFQEVGEVSSVQIVQDRETKRSRGFGFITMATDELAQQAIDRLNNRDVDGRQIRVSPARPFEASRSFDSSSRPPRERSFDRDRGNRRHDRY